MQELAVCGNPAMMDSLRVLLIMGIIFSFGVLMVAQATDQAERLKNLRRPKAALAEDCKLHSRKLKDCPPGSHSNSDDSPSQEPPTDDDSGATDGQGESALPDE
jgi:hypothetical protein